ncbi:MAG: Slp family lipoprotein [Chromatiaceae bacterium]|jgi:outer membrane lipoprotein|nr:Slp family lipoprotein [Chromatiaceae bacterium]
MSSSYVRRTRLVLLSCSLLGACATNVPTGLREEPPGAPSPKVVQAEPERFLDREVRWGGEILDVRNSSTATEVELYGRPLFYDAEPRPDGGDQVRFIARIEGFLDPAEYSPGKRMTVRGRLAEPLTRPVGDYAYRYPVVNVGLYHLWPAYVPGPAPGWWRDPYYDPWWPWGPWGAWPYRHWPYGW